MPLKMPAILTPAAFLVSLSLLTGCIIDRTPPKQELAIQIPPSPAGHRGTPLFCKAGRGAIQIGHGWDDFPDTMFVLYPGERVSVVLPNMQKTASLPIQAFFDREGQKIIFCPVVEGPPEQRIACASLYALDNDLNEGIKRTFDIPQALSGGSITCAYQHTKLKKLVSYSTN